jgi:hypothetical protein
MNSHPKEMNQHQTELRRILPEILEKLVSDNDGKR